MEPAPIPAPAQPGDAPPLGAILAGGVSSRYGAPKALAEIAGRRLIDRVRDALERAVRDPVLITHQPELYRELALPSRPDAAPGGGALAGVHTALLWAEELGRSGALVVACDTPFLPSPLLLHILARAREEGAHAVAPESTGRTGVEPLCAWYSTRALGEVEQRLSRGERSLTPLLRALGAARVPLGEVRRHGDPAEIFLNVNTREDRLRAERIARRRKERNGEP